MLGIDAFMRRPRRSRHEREQSKREDIAAPEIPRLTSCSSIQQRIKLLPWSEVRYTAPGLRNITPNTENEFVSDVMKRKRLLLYKYRYS